jgi:SLA1 homology domain 1, SHD1
MLLRYLLLLIFLSQGLNSLHGREWTDATGKFKQDADLVEMTDNTVVLNKGHGFLVSVPRESLSQADLEYLNSEIASKDMASNASQDRTWTMHDGKQVIGRVMEYGRREVVLIRRNNKLYVNDKPFTNMTELHQYVVPTLVSHYEQKPYADEKELLKLIISRRNAPLRYNVEGVLLELDRGELFAVPLFLFSTKDRDMLKPGWDAWNKADKDERAREEESLHARSVANEYQKNRDREVQIQRIQLASQWFDLWQVEVTLPNGQSSSVVVPGIDSQSAGNAAQARYPQATIGAMRKIRRRD